VLSLLNRSGHRPSHQDPAEQLERAIRLGRQAGFRRLELRGDTDFPQTQQLQAWDAERLKCRFGLDARPHLKARAEDRPASDWSELQRPPPSTAKGKP
jgi:hypothetical protein